MKLLVKDVFRDHLRDEYSTRQRVLPRLYARRQNSKTAARIGRPSERFLFLADSGQVFFRGEESQGDLETGRRSRRPQFRSTHRMVRQQSKQSPIRAALAESNGLGPIPEVVELEAKR